MADEDGEWIGVPEAARVLGVAEHTIYRMIAAGTLPALRFPARIQRAALAECIDRCRIRPGDLAHLDPNKLRRAAPGVVGPRSRQRVTDRRYGRRQGRPD